MKFRTETKLSTYPFSLSYQNSCLSFGSCFSEHIAKRLEDYRFPIVSNPFGILYNPISVATALEFVMEEREYCQSDLDFADGLYFSYDHHGQFSDENATTVLEGINSRIKNAHVALRRANCIFISFGSALVYELRKDKLIVANCHKIPQKKFNERLLKPSEIVDRYQELFEKLNEKFPKLNILFTVSPVRYIHKGIQGNYLSKSSLHLAISEIIEKHERCFYFPSYEMLMDDLRDYRFYEKDMIHPNEMAIDYIFEKFKIFFDENTIEIMRRIEAIQKDLNHRPRQQNSEAHRVFKDKLDRKIAQFKKMHPNISL